MKKLLILIFITCFTVGYCSAQGTFQNDTLKTYRVYVDGRIHFVYQCKYGLFFDLKKRTKYKIISARTGKVVKKGYIDSTSTVNPIIKTGYVVIGDPLEYVVGFNMNNSD